MTAAELESILRGAFAPTHLEVVDESAHHVGHAGAAAGGGHFRALIVAGVFAGKSALQRHRLVYAAVSDRMKGEIHALALRTYTPEEWREPAAS